MRHRVAKTKLSRDMDHRKMLLKNLSASVILHEKVDTTIDKAKFVQPYLETLITKAIKAAKAGDKISIYNAVKTLNSKIYSQEAVKKLLSDIASRYDSVTGGYTRIIRTGNRDGDNAITARIELTKKPIKARTSKATKEKKVKKETAVEETITAKEE